MAGKFQLITELYAEAAGEVSRDREAWKGFLASAGFNYRLRFDEQFLIYAQRPDASAVLDGKVERDVPQMGQQGSKGNRGIR